MHLVALLVYVLAAVSSNNSRSPLHKLYFVFSRTLLRDAHEHNSQGAYMPLSEKQQILDAHIRSPSVEIQGVVCGLESRKGDPSGPSVPWSFPLGKVAKGEGGAFPWPAPTPTTPTAFISIASTPVISDAGSEVDTRRTPPRIRAASLSPRSELRRMVRAAKASQGAIYNHMEVRTCIC
jgi:hypothetical protein